MPSTATTKGEIGWKAQKPTRKVESTYVITVSPSVTQKFKSDGLSGKMLASLHHVSRRRIVENKLFCNRPSSKTVLIADMTSEE
jgi:hypothetical protein